MRTAVILIVALSITGCHRAAPERQALDTLDDQLTGNAGDLDRPATVQTPRATADPSPARTAPIAPGPRQLVAATDHRQRTVPSCAGSLDYAASWVNRLPRGIALYPGAAVSEAAGTDAGGCALRVVSFTSAAPIPRVAAWYAAQTRSAGYAVEDRAVGVGRTLGGDRAGGAFILYLDRRRGGGTSADLIVKGGR